MPDPNAVSEWMSEVTVGMERLHGRQEAVEKSVDQLRVRVESADSTARATVDVLARIAKSEEDRLAFDKQQHAERLSFDKQQAEARSKWVERIWTSPVLQLLLTGLVVATLQFLGVAWLYSQMPAQPTAIPAGVHTPAGGGSGGFDDGP